MDNKSAINVPECKTDAGEEVLGTQQRKRSRDSSESPPSENSQTDPKKTMRPLKPLQYVPLQEPEGESEEWVAWRTKKLWRVLAQVAENHKIKDEAVMERALTHATEKLNKCWRLEFPTDIDVRHKFIRGRSMFHQFWRFVVFHKLPFDWETGIVTATPGYEPYIVTESPLEKEFRTTGLLNVGNMHLVIIHHEAAHLKEEHNYYHLRDWYLMEPIDCFTWIYLEEARIFKLLVSASYNVSGVHTEKGLMKAVTLACQNTNVPLDKIRRVIRRRRVPFLEFHEYIVQHGLVGCWKNNGLQCCVTKHYRNMTCDAHAYFDSQTPDNYREHQRFFIKEEAAYLPEEDLDIFAVLHNIRHGFYY